MVNRFSACTAQPLRPSLVARRLSCVQFQMPKRKYIPKKKKNHISGLPVEILQMILRYSISVPGFLDPEEMTGSSWPLYKHDRSDSSGYYEAERTRNILQRVCRSWDEYLRRYAHRFVPIVDVIHGNVPLQYLRTAIRIALDDPSHFGDLCKDCSLEKLVPDSDDCSLQLDMYRRYDYIQLCCHLLEGEKPLRAEIVNCGWNGDLILSRKGLEHIFPNLMCIHTEDVQVDTFFALNMIRSLPSLCHMYPFLKDVYIDNSVELKSPTLITLYLSIHIPNLPLTAFTEETLYLPALRHLYITSSWYERSQEYDELAWLPLVKAVGKELRTLFLPVEPGCNKKSVPEEIWSICPKLEVLHNLHWQLPDTPPPVGHPIHTLGVRCDHITPESALEKTVPDWPGLRTVRINENWNYWGVVNSRLTDPQTDWLTSRSLTLEDRMGEPYIKYLARIDPKK
jgi:hypothetical protein